MSGLAIFDVDGTLLRTSGVDDECYATALREVFGIDGISTDWGSYSHSTDGAILGDLIQERLHRAASAEDREAHRSRFVALLDAVARSTPDRFAATRGAAAALRALGRHGWSPAIATGGWRRSALLKLAVAGVDVETIPAAFADDDLSREGIIRQAIARAGGRVGGAPRRIVYVGDGLWDLRAARRLEIGFVGIAEGDRAAQLRAAGAAEVLAHFDPPEAFLAALERATRAASASSRS